MSMIVAVSAWDISHNALGRAICLKEMYDYLGFETRLIGCLVQNKRKSKKLWGPAKSFADEISYFEVSQVDELLPKAIEFAKNNPVSLLHLSKPRLPNIVLGCVYKLLYNTRVILDIDDEELGFVKNPNHFARNLSLDEQLSSSSYPSGLKDDFWTILAVKMSNFFLEKTVSNQALQEKYGGFILPHVRDEKKITFLPCIRQEARKKFNLKPEVKVVLFLGTPKRHKGLLETAHVLSQMKDRDVIFIIAGDFDDVDFKSELMSVPDVEFLFLPNQLLENMEETLRLGDVCILLQNQDSLIAQYQLPAKLVDAMAVGMSVFLQPTKATKDIANLPFIYDVSQNGLKSSLSVFFNQSMIDTNSKIQSQRNYFEKNLSMSAYKETFLNFVNKQAPCDNVLCQLKFWQLWRLKRMNILKFLSVYLSNK